MSAGKPIGAEVGIFSLTQYFATFGLCFRYEFFIKTKVTTVSTNAHVAGLDLLLMSAWEPVDAISDVFPKAEQHTVTIAGFRFQVIFKARLAANSTVFQISELNFLLMPTVQSVHAMPEVSARPKKLETKRIRVDLALFIHAGLASETATPHRSCADYLFMPTRQSI
jgi:hypothetical protein